MGRTPESKDKCASDKDIAKGAQVAGGGNVFQKLCGETIAIVVIDGVL